MAMHRRKVLKGLGAAAAGLAVVKAPYVHAQTGPIRVGFLTVKTGPLASGGLQMEQGLLTFLKDRNNMLGNRPVELTTADTTGNPAVCRTKMQELVERFNVSCVLGPLAAFEALAIDDYIRLVAHADAVRCRRRRSDAAQSQSVFLAAGFDLGAVRSRDGRLRPQGSQVQTRGHHRRRFRLRPRECRRLPARVRRWRRQGGAEIVDAAQRAGLRHLHLAAQARSRCVVHRACRLERTEAHPPVGRIRAEGQAEDHRRLHADRRVPDPADGR